MRANNKEIIKYLIENIQREMSTLNEIYLQIVPLIERAEKAEKEEIGLHEISYLKNFPLPFGERVEG